MKYINADQEEITVEKYGDAGCVKIQIKDSIATLAKHNAIEFINLVSKNSDGTVFSKEGFIKVTSSHTRYQSGVRVTIARPGENSPLVMCFAHVEEDHKDRFASDVCELMK